ncbi:hypothetical protein PRIPAC_73585, partial [Pristionchus pacificus]
VPESYKNAFVMGGHGTWSSRNGIGFIWPLVFSLAFPMLSFNFAYRLVAVKFPFRLELFKDTRVIAGLFAIATGNCLAWSIMSRSTGFDDAESQRYVHGFFTSNGSLHTYMRHDITDIDDYIVVLFWDRGFLNGFHLLFRWDYGFLDGIHWANCIGAATMGMLGSVAYTFMAYAAVNILYYMEKNSQWSERHHKQHVQLFRALVLQAMTPFVTSYIPLGLCGLLPFFGADFPLFSVLVPPLCAFHPVLDGVIMLTTVSQFRNTLIDWLRCRPQRRNSRVIMIELEDPTGRTTDVIGMRKMTVSPT